MRDLNRVNSSGVAKSRGYAFVNFTHHEHALKALHLFNNSTQVFGEHKVSAIDCYEVPVSLCFDVTSSFYFVAPNSRIFSGK